ncbi:hypothetical protein GPECTOR_55g277 [Gonium pectorale]|uniref:Major facilitator superfamily (MFS) profile domain-containing protein n=1 Tax=Gonium pectorale TaxID=33097 RepID=A0A150G6B4_GONPE|nr:hypothetical protein GPECTOR_55g277 [Gonium pectorale]|eukprot:KXZ45371.1 hypothetical protein GPECTOR_55g277 [Gonium pectorale]
MRSAVLPQRLACGLHQRCRRLPAPRGGIRMSVIVPSRDSASGNSDKRLPPYWLYSDIDAALETRRQVEALEEVYSREAPEPLYGDAPSTSQQKQEGQQQQEQAQALQRVDLREASAAEASSRGPAAEAEEDALDSLLLDAAALRERMASASLASTSDRAGPSGASASAHGRSSRLAGATSATAGSGSGPSSVHYDSWSSTAVLTHPGPSQPSNPHDSTHHEQRPHDLGTAPLNGHGHGHGHAGLNGAAHLPHLNGAAPLHGPAHLSGNHVALTGCGSSSSGNDGGATVAPAPPGAAPAAPAPVSAAPAAPDTSIPGSIWILCCISAALTCASCVFNTALPIYMVSELKMSMRSMGMFEGLLEAFSYVVRMCSGVVSDRMTSRKAAITLGFAAGAAAKFGMASAGTVGLLFAGKAVDRLANGVQAAPRDALIGDLSPAGVRSACFGLAQSLRKWGSAVGALAAFFLMKASNNNYQLIFYSAAAVSLTATIAFIAFVPAHTRPPREAAPAPAAAAASATQPQAAASQPAAAAAAAAPGGFLAGAREFLRSVANMGVDFYRMLGVICLYALGHINESLLEARAMEVGFGKAEATLVVAALAAVTFLTAYPLGRLDDRFGAGTTFAVGIGSLIAGDLVLLLSGPHPMALFAACAFLGVHWAVIQGPLLSIVSGLAPGHLRGTAFGIFYTVMAVTAVAANTMYGSIWHTYGANAAFATSAGLMSLVFMALPYMLPASARRGSAVAAAPAPVLGGSGKGGLAAAPLPAAA